MNIICSACSLDMPVSEECVVVHIKGTSIIAASLGVRYRCVECCSSSIVPMNKSVKYTSADIIDLLLLYCKNSICGY